MQQYDLNSGEKVTITVSVGDSSNQGMDWLDVVGVIFHFVLLSPIYLISIGCVVGVFYWMFKSFIGLFV